MLQRRDDGCNESWTIGAVDRLELVVSDVSSLSLECYCISCCEDARKIRCSKNLIYIVRYSLGCDTVTDHHANDLVSKNIHSFKKNCCCCKHAMHFSSSKLQRIFAWIHQMTSKRHTCNIILMCIYSLHYTTFYNGELMIEQDRRKRVTRRGDAYFMNIVAKNRRMFLHFDSLMLSSLCLLSSAVLFVGFLCTRTRGPPVPRPASSTSKSG